MCAYILIFHTLNIILFYNLVQNLVQNLAKECMKDVDDVSRGGCFGSCFV